MAKSILSNKKSMLMCGIALMLCIAGVFAYFTDREATNATVTTDAQAVDITTDPHDPTDPESKPEYENDLTGKWAAVNAEALANYNPGDKVDLGYILKNTGSKAIDVRETFFITSSEALTEDSPEFRLFQDAVQDAAGAWDGVDVVDVELIDAHTIKYTVAPYVLSSKTEVIGSNPVEVENTYKLIFDKASQNVFQAATCQVEYLIEAKQHTEDGPAGGWVSVETATIEFGGQTINVVPDKN